MKKIIFILVMSLIFISCGNNTNSVEESEELIEYVDTFKIGDIFISKSKDITEKENFTCEDIKIESVEDSMCIVNYSSKDKILHITYNGNTYNRYNVKFKYKKDNIAMGYRFNQSNFYVVENEKVYLILLASKFETHNTVIYAK